MERISPELALVDAELARIARVLLPDPWDPLALRFHRPAGPSAPTARAAAQPVVRRTVPIALPRERRTRRRRSGSLRPLSVAAGTVVIIAAIVGPQIANRPAKPSLQTAPEQPAARDATEAAKASTPADPIRLPQQAPDAKAKPTTRTVEIAWPAERSADVYNVILLRKGMRIDLWSTKNTLDLTTKASRSARRVAPGTYKWFVYPGVRRAGSVQYGALIAHGVVRASAD